MNESVIVNCLIRYEINPSFCEGLCADHPYQDPVILAVIVAVITSKNVCRSECERLQEEAQPLISSMFSVRKCLRVSHAP